MKNEKTKDIYALRTLYLVIALTAGALGVLYLSGILQTLWCLNCVLGLAVLLQGVLAALSFVRRQNLRAGLFALLSVFFLVALVYFNV